MNDNTAPDLKAILSAQSHRGFARRWRLPMLAALALMLALAYWRFAGDGENDGPRYQTETVQRAALVVNVTATGNLEPTNQVDLGSELSGTVAAVFVDDDDRVSQGQVLARLDISKFEDAVARSRAALAVAEAGLEQARATVTEARAKLTRFREVARLSNNKVPSQTELEAAEAELARGDANVASARAGIAEARATLRSDETNLNKAHIRSPIDGVVLQRAVDPGQAVAASLQAVTLFRLAEDLTRMELKVDVDEADVGQVRPGLDVSFSVDAWPDRRFDAVITRVGFNASDDDGVISYPAVLQVNNDDLSLRPGMTGTAEITTVTREDALLVPNAALRFSPTQAVTARRSRGLVGSLMPRPPARSATTRPASTRNGNGQRVWVLRAGEPTALAVNTGASDGRYTEITGGELQAGMAVITETLSADK